MESISSIFSNIEGHPTHRTWEKFSFLIVDKIKFLVDSEKKYWASFLSWDFWDRIVTGHFNESFERLWMWWWFSHESFFILEQVRQKSIVEFPTDFLKLTIFLKLSVKSFFSIYSLEFCLILAILFWFKSSP